MSYAVHDLSRMITLHVDESDDACCVEHIGDDMRSVLSSSCVSEGDTVCCNAFSESSLTAQTAQMESIASPNISPYVVAETVLTVSLRR